MIKLHVTKSKARKLLRLAVGSEQNDGKWYHPEEDEWKYSSYGEEGDYGTNVEFFSREELETIVRNNDG